MLGIVFSACWVLGSVYAAYWAQCMLPTGLSACWVLGSVHAGYWIRCMLDTGLNACWVQAQCMLGAGLSACWVLCSVHAEYWAQCMLGTKLSACWVVNLQKLSFTDRAVAFIEHHVCARQEREQYPRPLLDYKTRQIINRQITQ